MEPWSEFDLWPLIDMANAEATMAEDNYRMALEFGSTEETVEWARKARDFTKDKVTELHEQRRRLYETGLGI